MPSSGHPSHFLKELKNYPIRVQHQTPDKDLKNEKGPKFTATKKIIEIVKKMGATVLTQVRRVYEYFCQMFASLPSTCLLVAYLPVACLPIDCLPIACFPIDCLPFFLNACLFALSATFLMLAVLLPVASQTT
jgi:hypothetical protein